MNRNLLVSSLLALTTLGGLALSACATQEPADELAGESALDGEAGKADGVDNFRYVSVKAFADRRTGTSGYTLARVNRSTMLCADGHGKAACKVRTFDWSQSNLTDDQITEITSTIGRGADSNDGVRVLLRGTPKHLGGGIPMDVFVVEEAWAAQGPTGAFDGPYLRLADNGLRCITAPCPTTGEQKLNSTITASIGSVNLDVLEDEDVKSAAFNHIQDAGGTGIIIAGYRFSETINGQRVKGREATQVFFQVAPATAATPAE